MPMKKIPNPRSISRRDFLRTAAVGTAALAMPLIIPSRLLGADAPSNRIRVGQVGCGRIATVHDLPGVLNSGLADIVAVCDLDSKRAAAGKECVGKFYRGKNLTPPEIG